MKPQMLFGAVMSLVATFNAGSIGAQLSGQNPTRKMLGNSLSHILMTMDLIALKWDMLQPSPSYYY